MNIDRLRFNFSKFHPIERQSANWIIGSRIKRKLYFASLFQSLLAVLDVLFLALIASFVASLSGGGVLPSAGKTLLASFSSQDIFALIFVVVLIKNMASILTQRYVAYLLANREAAVSAGMLQAYLLRQMDNSEDAHSSELIGIFTVFLTNIFSNLFKPIVTLVAETATVISVLFGLLYISPIVAVCTVFYFLIIALLYVGLLGKYQRKIGAIAASTSKTSLRTFTEIVRSQKEIRFSHTEDDYLANVYERKKKLTRMQASQSLNQAMPRYFLEICLISGLSGLIFLWPHDRSSTLFSVLGLLVAAGYRILPSINNQLIIINGFRQTLAPLRIIFEAGSSFGATERSIELRLPTREGPRIKFNGDLEFRDVCFSYPKGNEIFSNLSFKLRMGESLLLQGPSGSGKTTFIGLASGLLRPTLGKVLIVDSKSASENELTSTVSGIGYLGSDVALFDDDFLFNICLSRDDVVDFDRLKNIVDAVGLTARVNDNRLGLNAQIGENGQFLSKGERQRIGLARILYAQNPFIILDEPTSNLDSATAELVWLVLQELRGKSTMIIVSHGFVPPFLYDFKKNLGTSL